MPPFSPTPRCRQRLLSLAFMPVFAFIIFASFRDISAIADYFTSHYAAIFADAISAFESFIFITPPDAAYFHFFDYFRRRWLPF
jgi:hypothetical protein